MLTAAGWVCPQPTAVSRPLLESRRHFLLAEPVVNEDGPKLVHPTQANCVELTHALLADVVDRVVTWYDALESVLIA